jgi:D-alanyl-D-alanine carboxypeptidase/D-alanyl-D-alanine-endopeptidase (penicillin-binding protein 4)
MKIHLLKFMHLLAVIISAFTPFTAFSEDIPDEMQGIMGLPNYKHSIWGIYAKDLQSGRVLFDLNAEKLFSPASTTKLFSVAALLQAYGDNYRFQTPVFASNAIKNGKLQGDLVLIAQGDLTMGGRQSNPDTISFTKLDHINANEIPGVTLTKEDPLQGINDLAMQIYQKGLRELSGDVIIDDSLFETTIKRGMTLSPIIINENLIDVVINPNSKGSSASLTWRPQVPGYEVKNEVKTVSANGKLEVEVTSEDGHKLVVKGTVPSDQKNIVRTFSIQDPKAFARAAFIQALQKQGIKVAISDTSKKSKAPFKPNKDLQLALWTSPPLSEYGKLILKVSHNLGANLVPLLLASQQGKKTFDEGMQLLGNFAVQQVKLSPDEFVFIDGAGGNENRLTPKSEIQLLDYMHKRSPKQFERYFDGLPILGVDGSLEDFGKDTDAVNKVHAKPGTGVAFNLSTQKFFLITQALAGYIEGKNGHLFAYEVVVNNGKMPAIDDVFAIFEDVSQLSSMIYNHTE